MFVYTCPGCESTQYRFSTETLHNTFPSKNLSITLHVTNQSFANRKIQEQTILHFNSTLTIYCHGIKSPEFIYLKTWTRLRHKYIKIKNKIEENQSADR